MKKSVRQLIPVVKKNITWEKNSDGTVAITIWYNSWLENFLRKFIAFPEKSVVDLDNFGSFIWQNIDAQKSVFDIVSLVQEKFGKKTEPTYKRTLVFFKQLLDNKLIKLEKTDADSKSKQKKVDRIPKKPKE